MSKIDDLRKAAELAIAALQAAEAELRETSWGKIDKLIADCGITKDQIIEHFGIEVAPAAPATNRKMSMGEKIVRASAPVTHQDPTNPENKWTSRGRPPRWLQAYLDQGRGKDEFLVK
jgi:DNA-binding protein H-NS